MSLSKIGYILAGYYLGKYYHTEIEALCGSVIHLYDSDRSRENVDEPFDGQGFDGQPFDGQGFDTLQFVIRHIKRMLEKE